MLAHDYHGTSSDCSFFLSLSLRPAFPFNLPLATWLQAGNAVVPFLGPLALHWTTKRAKLASFFPICAIPSLIYVDGVQHFPAGQKSTSIRANSASPTYLFITLLSLSARFSLVWELLAPYARTPCFHPTTLSACQYIHKRGSAEFSKHIPGIRAAVFVKFLDLTMVAVMACMGLLRRITKLNVCGAALSLYLLISVPSFNLPSKVVDSPSMKRALSIDEQDLCQRFFL